MSTDNDLRGSTPVLTAKDVLLEVRTDVRDVKTSVDILVSQKLGERVTNIEQFQNRLIGLAWASGLLGLIGTGLGIWSVVSSLT